LIDDIILTPTKPLGADKDKEKVKDAEKEKEKVTAG
jgi:hypothetical protein